MRREETARGRVILLLAILTLFGGAAAAVPFFLTPPAFLELSLTDGIFGSDLEGRVAQLEDLDRGSTQMIPIRQTAHGFGSDVLRIPSGPTHFELAVPGFSPATLALELADLSAVRRELTLEPTFGRLEVSVFDARTADQPVEAPVRIAVAEESVESRNGEPAVLELDAGRYKVAVEADRYCAGDPQPVSVRARETTRVALRIPPDLTGGERARAMLDWAENPRDLDAHVLVSAPSGSLSSRHVFYAHQEGRIEGSGGGVFASLDVDWLNSEGVETTTVHDTVDGVYQYFVHHYAGSGDLGGSEATVVLLTAGCQRKLYRVPPACREKWWYVADLKVDGGEVNIVDRESCQSNPPFPWDRGGKG